MRYAAAFTVFLFGIGSFAFSGRATADVPSNFSLLVTPSPIVATVTPGKTTQLQVKILNNGDGTENLQIQPKAFSINPKTGAIDLSSNPPAFVTSWMSFSAPKFTIAEGQWFTENISLAVPSDAGFSYSFALFINRQSNPQPTQGGRLIKGSVAIFTLININRPGAVRKLSVVSFTSTKHIYEWLPASFTVRFKNIGNTIVAPYGNIFIQRTSDAKVPIDTLPVNSAAGYVLPGVARSFVSSWNNGFPAYQTYTTAAGTTEQRLTWDWSKLSNLRIGHYSANLVAVYDNGTTEVPIEGQLSFWVLPWKLLLVLLVFVVVLLLGFWSIIHKIIRLLRRPKKKAIDAAEK